MEAHDSTPAPPGAPPPPRALKSLSDGIRLAHRHFLKLFPLALLVDWTIEAAVTLATGGGPGALYRGVATVAHDGGRTAGRPFLLGAALLALDAFVPALVATALVARAARSLERGRPARPLASLASGLRRLHIAAVTAAAFSIFPTAAAWLFYNLIEGLSPRDFLVGGVVGLLLLFATALLVAAIIARFALATPAAVLERRGLIGAWRRSERLVEGSMWRVIGLVVVVGLFWAIVVRGAVGGAVLALAEEVAPSSRSGGAPPLALALAFARSALEAWFHLVVAVVTTLLFERVRRAREGPDAEELQRIFA